MAEHNEIGAYGEYAVYRMLSTVGETKLGGESDICFMGCNLEVKTSKPSLYNGKNRGYQFLLRKDDKHGKTNFRKSDIVVLVCLDRHGDVKAFFVIPQEVIRDRVKLTIPLSLSSKWAYYKDKWETIAGFVTTGNA